MSHISLENHLSRQFTLLNIIGGKIWSPNKITLPRVIPNIYDLFFHETKKTMFLSTAMENKSSSILITIDTHYIRTITFFTIYFVTWKKRVTLVWNNICVMDSPGSPVMHTQTLNRCSLTSFLLTTSHS